MPTDNAKLINIQDREPKTKHLNIFVTLATYEKVKNKIYLI